MILGATEITVEDIENFLNDSDTTTPVVETDSSHEDTPPTETSQSEVKPVTETQAFAHRLKEEKEKVRREEQANIAKSMGYESYDTLIKAREEQVYLDKGLKPEEVSPIVEEIVKQRLAEDPRLKELETIKQQKVAEWAKKELSELSSLTDGKISKLEDVPKDVLEQWKKGGSLKAAYLELKGEDLIRQIKLGTQAQDSRGTTSHLSTPPSAPVVEDTTKRPLTDKEKDIYRLFNPNVSDEALEKMRKDK